MKDDGNERTWRATAQLSIRHQLTVYDATSMERAVRLALPLAALDQRLRAAAQAEGVAILP
jgi:predicted nucleic acid-binding protein